MKSKEVASSSGKSMFIVPEDSDDLFTLRRIIKIGNIVVSDTSRVIKFENEYSRPDRERVKIRVSVKVEKIGLDESIDISTHAKEPHQFSAITPGDSDSYDRRLLPCSNSSMRLLARDHAGPGTRPLAADMASLPANVRCSTEEQYRRSSADIF